MNYWDRLKALGMYSLERRRERYLILYTYKIILGLAPNFEDQRFKIKTMVSERRGLSCVIPPIKTNATERIKSCVENSFSVRAPRIFNCLPKDIRSQNLNFPCFKKRLDEILTRVEDCPSFPELRPRAASNSILDQIDSMKRDGTYNTL